MAYTYTPIVGIMDSEGKAKYYRTSDILAARKEKQKKIGGLNESIKQCRTNPKA